MATICTATACSQSTGYATVSPQQFAHDIHTDSTAYILDVRTPQEYDAGHIDDAHNLDWLNPQVFKAGTSQLPKDSTIYVYCRSGRRSADAASYLTDLGYKVVDLDGGYLAWEESKSKE